MEKASKATWKKHRNMEKASQNEKKAPQHQHQYPLGGARKSNWYEYMMAAALRWHNTSWGEHEKTKGIDAIHIHASYQ